MRLTSPGFLLLPLALMAFLSALASPASSFTQCNGCRELETSQLELESCINFRYPDKQLAIRDEATMKSLVRNDMSRERCLASLKDIDFSKHSLVGVELRTGWCRDPLFTYRVFKDEANKKYLLSVRYQPPVVPCRALDQYDLWVLVPKLPEQYEFDVEAKAESPKSKSQ